MASSMILGASSLMFIMSYLRSVKYRIIPLAIYSQAWSGFRRRDGL